MPRAVAMLFAVPKSPRFRAVLLEPGDREPRLRIELALDAAQVLVEFTVDELQCRLHRHRAVVGFQHCLAAAEDAHAWTDGRLRHVGGGDVGRLKLGERWGQLALEGAYEFGTTDDVGILFPSYGTPERLNWRVRCFPDRASDSANSVRTGHVPTTAKPASTTA